MPDRPEQPQRTVPPGRRRTVVVPDRPELPPLPRDPVMRRRVLRARGW